MNENDLYRSFQQIDDDILERSEGIAKKSRKNSWIKWAVMAVFLGIVMVTVLVTILRENVVYVEKDSTYGIICKLQKRYNKKVYRNPSEIYISPRIKWPKEYSPLYLDCKEVTFNKKHYDTKTSSTLALIDESLLGETLGNGKSKITSGTLLKPEILDITLPVREILGVSSDLMIAVEMEGKYYVFENPLYGTKTLGDMLNAYNLSQIVNLERYEWNDEYFILKEDDTVWELLEACSDAKYTSNFPKNDSEIISFTVSSESLGIHLDEFRVRADGYVDMENTFFIGEEAAKEIIDYVKANSQKTGYDPYVYEIAGTFLNVKDGYIWLDDALLCRNKYKGKTFRINLKDFVHIRRYFECGEIQRGQLVIFTFSGTIKEGTGDIMVDSYCNIETFISVDSESWFDILKRNLEVVLVNEVKN